MLCFDVDVIFFIDFLIVVGFCQVLEDLQCDVVGYMGFGFVGFVVFVGQVDQLFQFGFIVKVFCKGDIKVGNMFIYVLLDGGVVFWKYVVYINGEVVGVIYQGVLLFMCFLLVVVGRVGMKN